MVNQSNNSSVNSNAQRFKSFVNPQIANPYNAIKLNNSNNNNSNSNNPIELSPIKENNNIQVNENENFPSSTNTESSNNFNAQNSPYPEVNNNSNEFNHYKTINLSQNPLGSDTRESIANSEITMNLGISVIKNIPEEGDLENSNYPDINQLDDKKQNPVENEFNFVGSNNFDVNFNSGNIGDANFNQINREEDKNNNFGDEFEF